MKTKKILLLVLGGLIFTMMGCKDKETDIEKYYEGNWAISSSHEELDTTVIFHISSEGQFQYQVLYGGGELTIVGEVKDDGVFTSDINVNENTIGAVNGTLTQSGTGSGKYVIVNKEFGWSAKKK